MATKHNSGDPSPEQALSDHGAAAPLPTDPSTANATHGDDGGGKNFLATANDVTTPTSVVSTARQARVNGAD